MFGKYKPLWGEKTRLKSSYDAVIIGHSQFEKIPISQERQIRQLEEQKDAIAADLDFVLDWDPLSGQDCRIAVWKHDVSPDDRDAWRSQHLWLAEKLNKLHGAFSERIKRLP